jgi:NitT/TauT family transport system ATP-binding protein
MPEIRFESVTRSFGDHLALDRVDVAIERGSLTAIVGPSGCGKSTLLDLAAGLQEASGGRVTIAGVPVAGPRSDVVMLFQQHNLFDWLNVRDNVAFGLRNGGLSRRAARTRALAQLRSVGLGEFADRVPRELSGGMRQRVALARALVVEPSVLLMDEPFANLDHQTRRVMQRYLLSVWRRSGATIVLVTHDLEEALALADRIVLISGSPGRISDVVDVALERPRDDGDPRLRDVKHRLRDHLEREVALHEFAGAELEALDAETPVEQAALGHSDRNGTGR